MHDDAGGAGGQAGGLVDSLKALARSLIGAAQTRVELIGNEIEEQRALFMREVILVLIAVFCLALGIVFGALFLVLVTPVELRTFVAAAFALLFFLACGGVFAFLRASRGDRPKVFETTAQELEKDRDALR